LHKPKTGTLERGAPKARLVDYSGACGSTKESEARCSTVFVFFGSFVAPFDGIHGWFWRNHSDKPVTIKVKVSGFFEKLYVPS